MLKQMSDRADNLFSSSQERVDSTSGNGVEVTPNPISKLLFPEQQALTAEEKLQLVKHDLLSIRTETENSEQSTQSEHGADNQHLTHSPIKKGEEDSINEKVKHCTEEQESVS